MKIFRKIGSLNVTLILLFSIALSSMIGTLIVQQQDNQFYMQKYGPQIGRIILIFKADNFFNSRYYNILLFCLGLNLLACTVNSFKLILLKSRRKLAIFLLHFGVLVVFIGAMIGNFTKQSQHYILFPGEKVTLPKGRAEVVLKSFNIEYYPGSQVPKEYKSQLGLFDDGVWKSNYSLRVNHPLRYKGFIFYQSGFEVAADIEMKISHKDKVLWEGLWEHGKPLQPSGENGPRFEMAHFFPDISVDEQRMISLRSYNMGNAAMLIRAYRGKEMIYEQWVFYNAASGHGLNSKSGIFDFEIKKIEPVNATIIQVIKDPGLAFVMSGFTLLLLGMLLLLSKEKVLKI